MRTTALLSLAMATAATAAFAQGPVPPMAGPRAGGPPAAQMLLAHTGELGLSDAQVVRLAAIARRSEARRVALRANFDSARRRFSDQPVDSAARRQFRQRMETDLVKARDAQSTDQRDALAVLTADQQAKAWDLRAGRERGMRRGMAMRRGPGGPGGLRGGMRGEMRREFRDRRDMPAPRPDRPFRGRPPENSSEN